MSAEHDIEPALTTNRPRIALLGCGYWGFNHLRVWSELGCLSLACDPDPRRQSEVRSLFPDLELASSLDDVVDRADIDAVVIATPAMTHYDLACRAIEAGKHVLIEKPMTTTLDDARSLVEIADAHPDIVVLVGHVLEYHPAVTALRQLVQDGVLGEIRYVYSNRLNFGKLRTEENALWSFAPHDLALILRILVSSPDAVSCQGGSYVSREVADTTLMSLRFRGGVRGHIFVSWLHPFKEQRFVVVGADLMAVFDDTAPWPEKLRLFPHKVHWVEGRLPVASKAESISEPVEPAEPLRAEAEHFLDCIRLGTNPLTDVRSGLAVLQLLAAGEESLAKGGTPILLLQSNQTPDVHPLASIHPTAVIDEGARIGAGTMVWHWTHVSRGGDVGRDCVLGQNVYVADRVRIGDRSKVQNNVSIFEGVELEEEVFCGPSAVFTNVINPRAAMDRKLEFRRTLVRRGATLGANATVVCGTTIGEYAFVAAGAVVTSDVGAFELVAGTPARRMGWMCQCGIRLTVEKDMALCSSCHHAYHMDGPDRLLLCCE